MDKISDFFHDIKDRATNPLISSFIIAWLLWNWKIPVGVLFMKPDILAKECYTSMIDFIEKNLRGIWHPILLPVLSAIIYTIAIPIVKMYVSALITHFKTKSISWNLKLAGEGVVPGSFFVQLREEYSKKKREIAEQVKNEAETFSNNKELVKKNELLEKEISVQKEHSKNLRTEREAFFHNFNVKHLDGIWFYQYMLPNRLKHHQKKRFLDGEIFDMDKDNNKIRVGNIRDYCINLKTNKVSFAIEFDGRVTYQFLLFNSDFTVMEGNSHEGLKVRYSKDAEETNSVVLQDALIETEIENSNPNNVEEHS